MERSLLVSSSSSTIFFTPVGAFLAAFLLDSSLLIMLGEEVLVVGLSTRNIVQVTGVAKLKPQTEVCFAITDI